jgi:hypothetical protein
MRVSVPGGAAKVDIAARDAFPADGGLQGSQHIAAAIEGIAADREVRDLARRPARTAQLAVVGHDAHSDTCPQRNKAEVRQFAPPGLPPLAVCGEIDVVLHVNGKAGPRLQSIGNNEAIATGNVGRHENPPSPHFQGAGAANDAKAERGLAKPGFVREAKRESRNLREDVLALATVGRHYGIGHDPFGPIGNRGVQLRTAEIDSVGEGPVVVDARHRVPRHSRFAARLSALSTRLHASIQGGTNLHPELAGQACSILQGRARALTGRRRDSQYSRQAWRPRRRR